MHVDNSVENYCGYEATELGEQNLYRKQSVHHTHFLAYKNYLCQKYPTWITLNILETTC